MQASYPRWDAGRATVRLPWAARAVAGHVAETRMPVPAMRRCRLTG
jgi:hypothetical protein